MELIDDPEPMWTRQCLDEAEHLNGQRHCLLVHIQPFEVVHTDGVSPRHHRLKPLAGAHHATAPGGRLIPATPSEARLVRAERVALSP
jgi:hypothetical protein